MVQRCSAQLYLTEQWACWPRALDGWRASEPEVLELELLELWSVELKELVEELMKLESEAPQCAQL